VRSTAPALAAVVLLAINLRTLFASIPPLLAEVRHDFGLSAGVGGLLTTGPVLCLGALGPVAPRLARRVSIERCSSAAASSPPAARCCAEPARWRRSSPGR
jgi:cyanate permease